MATETWQIDPVHSSVGFWVRHMMVSKVHGRFDRWNATFHFDPADARNNRVSASIEAASIDTREPNRDAHLRSPDFFDVEKHPTLTFESRGVERVGDERFQLFGDLTIHGVTKPVTLDVEYLGRSTSAQAGERIGFSARTTISRKDFGLTWNAVIEAGGVAVGDKVEIAVEIEAKKG